MIVGQLPVDDRRDPPDDLIADTIAAVFASSPLPKGHRVAVVTASGGGGTNVGVGAGVTGAGSSAALTTWTRPSRGSSIGSTDRHASRSA